MSGWDFLIIATITAILIPLISAGVNATRTKKAAPSGDGKTLLLCYPRGFRVLCIGMLVGCLGMGILIAFVVDAESQLDRILGILIIILPLTIVSAWLLYDSKNRQFAITDDGLESRSPSRTTLLAWADIDALHYSFLNSWLVITGRTGVRIRVSRYMNGTHDLCEALTRRVRPEVLAGSRTFEIFRQLSVMKRDAA